MLFCCYVQFDVINLFSASLTQHSENIEHPSRPSGSAVSTEMCLWLCRCVTAKQMASITAVTLLSSRERWKVVAAQFLARSAEIQQRWKHHGRHSSPRRRWEGAAGRRDGRRSVKKRGQSRRTERRHATLKHLVCRRWGLGGGTEERHMTREQLTEKKRKCGWRAGGGVKMWKRADRTAYGSDRHDQLRSTEDERRTRGL